MNFNFIASNEFSINDFNDVEKFVDSFPDFQSIMLDSESQLELLLNLIGVNCEAIPLIKTDFLKYWDLGTFRFPEFNDEQFEAFYQKWLNSSKRDNNMDEFGSLIFLKGLTPKWNKLQYRLIVRER